MRLWLGTHTRCCSPRLFAEKCSSSGSFDPDPALWRYISPPTLASTPQWETQGCQIDINSTLLTRGVGTFYLSRELWTQDFFSSDFSTFHNQLITPYLPTVDWRQPTFSTGNRWQQFLSYNLNFFSNSSSNSRTFESTFESLSHFTRHTQSKSGPNCFCQGIVSRLSEPVRSC